MCGESANSFPRSTERFRYPQDASVAATMLVCSSYSPHCTRNMFGKEISTWMQWTIFQQLCWYRIQIPAGEVSETSQESPFDGLQEKTCQCSAHILLLRGIPADKEAKKRSWKLKIRNLHINNARFQCAVKKQDKTRTGIALKVSREARVFLPPFETLVVWHLHCQWTLRYPFVLCTCPGTLNTAFAAKVGNRRHSVSGQIHSCWRGGFADIVSRWFHLEHCKKKWKRFSSAKPKIHGPKSDRRKICKGACLYNRHVWQKCVKRTQIQMADASWERPSQEHKDWKPHIWNNMISTKADRLGVK